MPELDEDPGTIARVTPLGLEPVTDAAYMTALNQRVLDMLTAKVTSQAAELSRWIDGFERVFAQGERRLERIEKMEAALTNCVTMLEAYMVHYDGSPAAKSSTLLQVCRAALEE